MSAPRTVALVTLGCTRNEVDSEELAGRLAAEGWSLVEDADQADVAVVNTCGFVEQAKKDSIDALLEASDLKGSGARTQAVVAVGCLAERYGRDLAAELPEADAVLGFDSYATMSQHLRDVLAGRPPASHEPGDRRRRLPISPVARQASVRAGSAPALPGHGTRTASARGADLPRVRIRPVAPADSTPRRPAGLADVAPASGPRILRSRLDDRPWAPLKIASGCDRRCSFCAIPMFRGSFVSRPPQEVVQEAHWLAERGVKEVFLVSENTTSYGKDLGDLRSLETLLPHLTEVPGIERVRVSYLQPAEIRPGLIEILADTPGVVPYFDLSFQHASGPLLRRMRRFGDRTSFLELLDRIRTLTPEAGARTNVIVGFPGETEDDVAELEAFLDAARLDVVGVFGYSDEDGTEAATFPEADKLPEDVVAARVDRLTARVEELMAQRAEDRVGTEVEVLVEGMTGDDDTEGDGGGDDTVAWGRSAHQGPEIDGTTRILGPLGVDIGRGSIVAATVVAADGVDLIAVPR